MEGLVSIHSMFMANASLEAEKMNPIGFCLAALLVLCFMFVSFDAVDFWLALSGAFGVLVVRTLNRASKTRISCAASMARDSEATLAGHLRSAPWPARDHHARHRLQDRCDMATSKIEVDDEDVRELLEKVAPTPSSADLVTEIVRLAKDAIQQVLPGARVTGYANCNPEGARMLGAAAPETDIVVTANPDLLMRRLQARLTRAAGEAMRQDGRKLQKCALRTCTDQLVAAGFKFRRSAFRGAEPKVTLMVPATLIGSQVSIPIDLWVNATTPLRSNAVLNDSNDFDARAGQLIMLVWRWARNRGISGSQMPFYAWNLLVVNFLQARNAESILPSFGAFPQCRNLASRKTSADATRAVHAACAGRFARPRVAVDGLFKEFINFYSELDLGNYIVSVRSGKPLRRESPGSADSVATKLTMNVGPLIEDPFDAGMNVCSGMSEESFVCLLAEIARAREMLDHNVPFAKLMEQPLSHRPYRPRQADDQADSDESPKDSPRSASTDQQEADITPPRSPSTVQRQEESGIRGSNVVSPNMHASHR